MNDEVNRVCATCCHIHDGECRFRGSKSKPALGKVAYPEFDGCLNWYERFDEAEIDIEKENEPTWYDKIRWSERLKMMEDLRGYQWVQDLVAYLES